VRAERSVSRSLGAAAHDSARRLRGAGRRRRLRLRALVGSPDGRRLARADCEGDAGNPTALGEQAAAELRRQGAGEILSALK